jgi:plasmid maintenance system antidote protein VapI
MVSRVRSACSRGGSKKIVLGKRSITADTDLRLARYFGVSEGFWLGLQADHDLLQRRREIDADLARIAPYQRAA